MLHGAFAVEDIRRTVVLVTGEDLDTATRELESEIDAIVGTHR